MVEGWGGTRVMKCPACAHENRPGAKFCEECAGTLKRVCASCKAELRPTAKFCDECGASTAAAATQPDAPAAVERSPRAYTPKHLADKIL